VEATAPNTPGRTIQGRAVIVTTRTNRRGVFYRRIGIFAAAMGLVSFALGYLIHPL
jgi:hypothetical protein